MPRLQHRQVAGHEVVEIETAKAYRPYDRLVLREAKGRTVWTVLLCGPSDRGWVVTAIRCPGGCQIHRQKR